MNIRKLKQQLWTMLIGGLIFALWVVYAIITQFDFIAFITNPSVISILLILIVPFSFFIAETLFKDK